MSTPFKTISYEGSSSLSTRASTLIASPLGSKSQWDLAVERKIGKLKQSDAKRLQKLLECDDQQQALEHMVDEYTKKGFAALVHRFEPLFFKLRDFSVAVTTMVQSQGLASLIWGSVQFILLVCVVSASK
jgi:hypothetical protein